jgi:hypothetical protein
MIRQRSFGDVVSYILPELQDIRCLLQVGHHRWGEGEQLPPRPIPLRPVLCLQQVTLNTESFYLFEPSRIPHCACLTSKLLWYLFLPTARGKERSSQ